MKILLALVPALFPLVASADPAFYRFVRDDRPSDGALVEVMLSSAGEGAGFVSTYRTATYSRVERREVETFRLVGSDLACEFRNDSKGLVSANCSHDDRPLDGALVELKVIRTADGLFEATARLAYYDQQAGTEVDRTETLGSGLRSEGALGTDASSPKSH
jgi:hypothetical protein